MPCIESNPIVQRRRSLRVHAAAWATLVIAGCTGPSTDRAPGETGEAPRRPPPAAAAPPVAPQVAAAPPAAGPARRPLAPPSARRNWVEVRQQAAERLVAANPEITYMGKVPDVLLGIPVLEIELNGDGSIRRIDVLREPREAKETIKIAVDAVRRAAPFGDVSRLPKPWKFVETFLFDDARKFKPRTLDH